MENLEKITKFGKIMHIVEIVLFSALTIFALTMMFSAAKLVTNMKNGTGAEAVGGIAGVLILVLGITFLIVSLVLLGCSIGLLITNQKMQKSFNSENETKNKKINAYKSLNIIFSIFLIALAIAVLVVNLNVIAKIVFSVFTFALAVLHLVFTGMIIKKCKTQNNNVTNNA